jgi:hypothetical protein
MWNMGHLKERYLQFEKLGDQYLGQVVTGLGVNNVKFAVLPPFFDFDAIRPADRMEESVNSLLRDYMVCGKTIPMSVHHMFYFCFASLCFHFDFMSRVLHQKNKLQASHFFNLIPSYQRCSHHQVSLEQNRSNSPTHWLSSS